MIPAVAPIATPPARVAFKICYIVNLVFKEALVMKVDRQLPVNDKIVFIIIWVFVKGVGADAPKLNEGQYIQRKRVPTNPSKFEK